MKAAMVEPDTVSVPVGGHRVERTDDGDTITVLSKEQLEVMLEGKQIRFTTSPALSGSIVMRVNHMALAEVRQHPPCPYEGRTYVALTELEIERLNGIRNDIEGTESGLNAISSSLKSATETIELLRKALHG